MVVFVVVVVLLLFPVKEFLLEVFVSLLLFLLRVRKRGVFIINVIVVVYRLFWRF